MEAMEASLKLVEVQRPYDLFVSLGSACDPAAWLRVHGLRRFSMPLDWVVTNTLNDLKRLLENRFEGFMELEALRPIDGSANFHDEDNPLPPGTVADTTHFVLDERYKVISVHDFKNIPGQPWHAVYPTFKEKLESRIERLLTALSECDSVLFVRWAGQTSDAVALHPVLSTLTSGRADLLVLQPLPDAHSVGDRDIGVDGVCVVEVPNAPADKAIWDEVLQGMSLRV